MTRRPAPKKSDPSDAALDALLAAADDGVLNALDREEAFDQRHGIALVQLLASPEALRQPTTRTT